MTKPLLATLAALVTTALRGALWSLPGGVQRAVQSAKAQRRYPAWLNGRAETAPRFAAALPSAQRGDRSRKAYTNHCCRVSERGSRR